MEGTTAPKGALPDLKKYMEKRVLVRLQGNRKVQGTLRGYDAFMNIVLNETEEVRYDGSTVAIGNDVVVRGSTIVNLELQAA